MIISGLHKGAYIRRRTTLFSWRNMTEHALQRFERRSRELRLKNEFVYRLGSEKFAVVDEQAVQDFDV